MAVRALWQGTITFARTSLPIRLYSAVVDRAVHFHLLHNKDHIRLEQRMVNPRTGATVARSAMRKACPVDKETFVPLGDDEIDALAPESSRTLAVTRFAPRDAIALEWFDPPYLVGPASDHEAEYHAVAGPLAAQDRCGIAQWVMRKREYAGALCSESGHLLLVTLHRAGEVVSTSDLDQPSGRDLSKEEYALAEELIDALTGAFDPTLFHDTYQDEVRKLVEDGLRGHPIAARLRPDEHDYFVFKPKHSGFYSTTLEVLLEYLEVQTRILRGMAANICVLFTANDASMRDYHLVVPSDCVASNTIDPNSRRPRAGSACIDEFFCNYAFFCCEFPGKWK
jgi:DNA end-binding protein Ku